MFITSAVVIKDSAASANPLLMRLHNSIIACLFLGISAKTGGGTSRWWCWWRRERCRAWGKSSQTNELEWEYLFQMTLKCELPPFCGLTVKCVDVWNDNACETSVFINITSHPPWGTRGEAFSLTNNLCSSSGPYSAFCLSLPLGTSWKFSSGFTRDLGLLLFGLRLLPLLFRRYRFPLFNIRASPAGAGAVVRSLHFAGHRGPWQKTKQGLQVMWARQSKFPLLGEAIKIIWCQTACRCHLSKMGRF